MIEIGRKRKAQFGTWVHGVVDDGFGTRARFQAKVFEGPSMHGIPTARFEEGGNVSKFHLAAEDGRELYCWDRGLDYVDPGFEDEAEDLVHEIARRLEDMFCE